MRVLFLESHPMWIYGLPKGFKDAGHDVMVSGPLTKQKIHDCIFKFKPNLVISLGYTNEHNLKKQDWVQECIEKSKVPYVYWATEDSPSQANFTTSFIKRSCPDFIFTICTSRVKYYKEMGIPSAHLDFGCQLNNPKYDLQYSKTIAVVANAYPKFLFNNPNHFRYQSLQTLIKPLIKEKIPVDFWGRNWDKMKQILGTDIPQKWIHGHLHYRKANKVYANSEIIIGLQNHKTQLTQRTYEILGAGGFLLTSDTEEVRRLFKPKQDLVVSSSPDETLELVKYFINKPLEREKIRNHGKETVKKHTYKHRAKYMIDVLQKEGLLPKNK